MSVVPPSRSLFRVLALVVSLLIAAAAGELVFRLLEYRTTAATFREDPGNRWIADARWGFKPRPGWFREGTPEFVITGKINDQFMNERPWDEEIANASTRVLVLGDSHTFAVGVNAEQTWERQLEDKLNRDHPSTPYRMYDAACSGYSLHQYLLRLIDQGPAVKPDYVLVGLSYATDFYDLLPPDRGGWTYGGDFPRRYFDFDGGSDRLIEKEQGSLALASSGLGAPASPSLVARVRGILDYSATFRQMRRSNLALIVGSKLRLGGQSLWPNMDVIVQKDLQPEHQYQWRLALALLTRIKEEAERQGATLIVVGIPYLPQVYDEIWMRTFGGDARYSRTAAIERVNAWCQAQGAICVDTTDALRERVQRSGHWVHFRTDAHPTAEGQEVIAQRVFDAGVLPARYSELNHLSR